MHKTIQTPTLEIAYLEAGPSGGPPVVLLHGWPSDPHDWDGVVPPLAKAGCRVLTPWLRGYGPTRFLDPTTPRSGQQAALGTDLADFMDALGIDQAILGGYDWGGRAACVVAALWPERVRGLVSITGYNIQNIPASGQPASAVKELRYWYQWYLNTERGRAGLRANRRDIARLLWRLWSPNWKFSEATFEQTAASFDNEDFAEVTVHSYRHRFANAPGDPALEHLETRLAAQPTITVPTIVPHGGADGVDPPDGSEHDARHFSARYERRVVPVAGHFLARETPEPVVQAVRDLLA
ncbi:MAG TPA: alpha/beta hydrolase [Acetobacteraceae bacterium]|jgi:pimeloyl-ACP methyl ester carboxylesterase|nr:alpha/beta hydrolase [Acetobacteraceae bacterium]